MVLAAKRAANHGQRAGGFFLATVHRLLAGNAHLAVATVRADFADAHLVLAGHLRYDLLHRFLRGLWYLAVVVIVGRRLEVQRPAISIVEHWKHHERADGPRWLRGRQALNYRPPTPKARM